MSKGEGFVQIERLKSIILTLLDQVDYTAGACEATELVGAVLPKSVIELARKSLQEPNKAGRLPKVERYKMSLCATCDGWYDPRNAAEVKEHQHPEPQSGPPRDAWLLSLLPYERWIIETPEGRAWATRKEARP